MNLAAHDDIPAVPAAAYLRMSTDMQQYSILNQSLAIAAYADSHRMRIVRTCRDDGRSGLDIEHRPGLLSLMKDITHGQPGLEVILVLDVSRWGRFQNVDEAGFYEFLCWRAGVRVCYVAELFENDGSPFAMIVKGLKRAMAAEYSRELSGKTAAGHRHLASLGYHQGARPGYGLRRLMIDGTGKPRMALATGQRKNTTTDRVVLVPGPTKELRVIRWMFEQCAAGMSYTEIARSLNQRRVVSQTGSRWTYGTVRSVIESEKYAGCVVYGREQKQLGGPCTRTDPERWVRCDRALPAIVPRALFDAAQEAHRLQRERLSNEEVLRRVGQLLKREGRLSIPLINADPSLPESHACARRFGGLTALYRKLGFVQPRNRNCAASRAMVTAWRRSVTTFVADWLEDLGSSVERDGWQLRIDGAWSLSFSVLNGVGGHQTCWFNHRPVLPTDVVVFVRMTLGEAAPRDYLVLPRVLFPVWPRAFYRHNGPVIDSCTYPSLAILGDLAQLSRPGGV